MLIVLKYFRFITIYTFSSAFVPSQVRKRILITLSLLPDSARGRLSFMCFAEFWVVLWYNIPEGQNSATVSVSLEAVTPQLHATILLYYLSKK